MITGLRKPQASKCRRISFVVKSSRFHECDAWLSFALCHRSNEHVIRLEFRQSIRRLVRGELRRGLATQIGLQSLNGTCVALCAILAASFGGSGERSVLAVFASPEMSSCPA